VRENESERERERESETEREIERERGGVAKLADFWHECAGGGP